MHPAFDALVDRLGTLGWRWFLHTNASRLDVERARRCRAAGLQKALVSLHGPREAHIALSGHDAWEATLSGTDQLRSEGVKVVLNCVLARPNLPHLAEHIAWVAGRFPGAAVKLVWASRAGKGAAWAQAHLGVAALRGPLEAALDQADRLGVELLLEGLPRCAHRRWDLPNHGRSGWGESHYLDDDDGHRLVGMAWLDRQSRWHPPVCKGCTARAGCPGLPRGAEEDPDLVPRRSTR